MKYSKTNLKKIESLLKELGYTVRYEKGNFNSGHCIVEERKIAVINRFYDTEARINALLEIIIKMNFNKEELSEEAQSLLPLLAKQMSITDHHES